MIARKTWREVRLMALVYTCVLQLMLTPAILLWPELQEGIAVIGKAIPMRMFKDMFAAMTDDNIDKAFRAYAAVQLFFKGTNVVGIACAVLLGTGLIARERENHTLEFLLARPVSRSRMLWAKTWPVALCLVIPIFLTTWTAIPLAHAIDRELPFWELTACALYACLFVLFFFGLTLLASVICRTQVHVAALVGAVVILQLGLLFLPTVHVASIFHLSDFNVYGPLLAGTLRLPELLLHSGVWLCLGTLLLYLAADRALRRVEL